MLLTPAQLQEIKQIIADHHNAVVVNYVSPTAVSEDVRRRLEEKGLVDVRPSNIEDAYLYGQVLAALDDPKTEAMSYAQFRTYVTEHPMPLSDSERQAVAMAQARAAQYIVGLGNRVSQQTGETIIEADGELRARLRDTVRTNTERNIALRESVGKLKSDLGHSTQDWTRDLDRIAITEQQTAMQEGFAAHVAATRGSDSRVAKVSAANCCPTCRALYQGPDGAPRIFRLNELEANGTNVGRKKSAWMPTVGPVHPHCICSLVAVGPHQGFNELGQLVVGGKFGEAADADKIQASSAGRPADIRKSEPPQGSRIPKMVFRRKAELGQ